jgi:hypothetical protein
MRDKDQVAIFESYREDILNKFKKSLGGDDEPEKELSSKDDFDLETIEDVDSEMDDDIEIAPPKKKNVIVRSQEIGVQVSPTIREILRHLPDTIEDVDVLSSIKNAIKEVNDDLEDGDQIKDTPLSIYDDLIGLGIYSEEEVDSDDFEEKEADIIQDLDDDEYSDDNDLTGELDFDLSKKTRRDREDFRSGMRRDIERSRAEDSLRQMGIDWTDRGLPEDDY